MLPAPPHSYFLTYVSGKPGQNSRGLRRFSSQLLSVFYATWHTWHTTASSVSASDSTCPDPGPGGGTLCPNLILLQCCRSQPVTLASVRSVKPETNASSLTGPLSLALSNQLPNHHVTSKHSNLSSSFPSNTTAAPVPHLLSFGGRSLTVPFTSTQAPLSHPFQQQPKLSFHL